MKKRNRRFLLPVLYYSVLVGCSGQGIFGPEEVIVDRRNMDAEQYEFDLAECKVYADQVPVGERVAEGTIKGAAVGGVVGAVVGDSDTAKRSATATGVIGGTKAYDRSSREQERVVRNCMRGRGYRVLN